MGCFTRRRRCDWNSPRTSLVRLGGRAVAPFAAGALMQGVALATPLLIGAGMKIGYDLLLWKSFRDMKPPEEGTLNGA